MHRSHDAFVKEFGGTCSMYRYRMVPRRRRRRVNEKGTYGYRAAMGQGYTTRGIYSGITARFKPIT